VDDGVDMARYGDPPAQNHVPLLRRAAEARGIEIIEHGDGYIGLHDGRAVLEGGRYQPFSSTSALASTICRSKDLQLRLLPRAGVPFPEGRSFGIGDFEDAIEYATTGLGWPVVVKPSDVLGGQGVVVGIRSEEEFRCGWQYAVSAIGDRGERKVIVQREHDGVDLRVYVIAGEAVAGSVRLPPYVRGDGRSSVEVLVAEANQARLAHPRLRHFPITLDAETDRYLAQQGLRRDSIPRRRRVVPLRRCGNISLGGIFVDVTDRLPARLVDLAVRTMAVIPGLDAGGVDVLTPDIRSANGAVILEISSKVNISMYHFPVVGQPRDVAGALVDLALSLYS
jgi:D-alanine-D-alanine ligase-like ATP-grasp enzyme